MKMISIFHRTLLSALCLLLSLPLLGQVGGEVKYNPRKDITTYTVKGQGSFSMPGKMEPIRYVEATKQQLFSSKDGHAVSLSFFPSSVYEFNKDGEKSGVEFLDAYYQWEKDYLVKQGFKVEPIERNADFPYVIWKSYQQVWAERVDKIEENTESSPVNKGTANTDAKKTRPLHSYHMDIEQGGVMRKVYVAADPDKWTQEQAIELLKKISASYKKSRKR